jgi:hypothetical protein
MRQGSGSRQYYSKWIFVQDTTNIYNFNFPCQETEKFTQHRFEPVETRLHIFRRVSRYMVDLFI